MCSLFWQKATTKRCTEVTDVLPLLALFTHSLYDSVTHPRTLRVTVVYRQSMETCVACPRTHSSTHTISGSLAWSLSLPHPYPPLSDSDGDGRQLGQRYHQVYATYNVFHMRRRMCSLPISRGAWWQMHAHPTPGRVRVKGLGSRQRGGLGFWRIRF